MVKCKIAKLLEDVVTSGDSEIDIGPAKQALLDMISKKAKKKGGVMSMKIHVSTKVPKGYRKVMKVKKLG